MCLAWQDSSDLSALSRGCVLRGSDPRLPGLEMQSPEPRAPSPAHPHRLPTAPQGHQARLAGDHRDNWCFQAASSWAFTVPPPYLPLGQGWVHWNLSGWFGGCYYSGSPGWDGDLEEGGNGGRGAWGDGREWGRGGIGAGMERKRV